ncbi:MAG: diacylglycerol kinase family protein [bacterium]|nr:diacylglycerol kinase family protein [bacterium]
MNIFIYDSFLNQKKYDRLLARIETRITDLGLNGKISRLGMMTNIREAIGNELRRGAKTIIAVGNNKTVNQTLNSLAGQPVPLGIIPIGQEDNDLARGLGIESAEAACDILAARLVAKLDLGLADKTYFISSAAIANQGTIIDMNKSYTIETKGGGNIYVVNCANEKIDLPPKVKSRPDDGILELVINSQSGGFFSKQQDQSIFKIKKITVTNPKTQLILDGATAINTPAEITVAKKALTVIVGKNRKF